MCNISRLTFLFHFSVIDAEDCEQGTVLPDVPATSTSAPTEAPKKKKASWWRRLFRLKKKVCLSELIAAKL